MFALVGELLTCFVWMFLPAIALSFFSQRGITFLKTKVCWGIVCGCVIPWLVLLLLFVFFYDLAVKARQAPGEGGIAGLWFIFGGLGSVWIGTILGLFKKSIPTNFVLAMRWSLGWNVKFIATIVGLFLVIWVIGLGYMILTKKYP